jgi:hypothetical protein
MHIRYLEDSGGFAGFIITNVGSNFWLTMKLRTFFIVSALIFTCKKVKTDNPFIPRDYYFPQDKIGNGKTFVFIDQNTGDTSYQDLYFKYRDNTKYLVVKAYRANSVEDSLIYLDYKLKESYSYFFGKTEARKAEILQDTVIENGKKLGKEILKVKFKSDSTLLTIISESEFLKDTTFIWKGALIPTLVIKTTYNNTVQSNMDNETQKVFKLEFLTYQGEKTGTLRFKVLTTREGYPKNIDLIEIKDRPLY